MRSNFSNEFSNVTSGKKVNKKLRNVRLTYLRTFSITNGKRSNGSLNFCLHLFSVSEIETTKVNFVFYFDVSLLLCSLYKGLNEFDFNISRVLSRKQYVSKFKVVFKMMSIQSVVCNTSLLHLNIFF